MILIVHSIREDLPGPRWRQLFEQYWPSYKEWFLSEGNLARPGYVTSRKNLRRHMPELAPYYETLVDLAGGGDLAARFLSLYCPPPYLAGCSQAIWSRDEAFLIRNYDYHPRLFEGILLYTHWRRPVIAVSDCLWGVLDGINDAGLCVSLAFGGRRIVGEGFGAPLVSRYLLETCATTKEAADVLRRMPVHMPYNLTVLDRSGAYTTAFLSPDRPASFSDTPAITNHQQEVEWEDYVRTTSSRERKAFMEARLNDKRETPETFMNRFLNAPLYNTRFEQAFGTLYTAKYMPRTSEMELCWPDQSVRQSISRFGEQKIVVNLMPARTSFRRKSVS